MANNLAAFAAETWSKQLVLNLDQVNVMLPLVNRDWEGDLRQSKTVNIRTAGSITLGTYTKGTPITYQDLAPTKEQFTVNDAKYFAFEVEDIDAAQNDISAMEVYTKRAAVGMSNTVESKLLAPYVKVPSANIICTTAGSTFVTNVGDSTLVPITMTSEGTDGTSVYHLFVQARTRLTKQNVPMTGRWAIVDPDTTALLLEDTKHFIRATEMGDTVVASGMLGAGGEMTAQTAPGFIGRCAGFDCYETPHAPSDAGGKYLLFGDRWFISYASQITEIEPLRLQTQFANAIRGLLLHDTFVSAENAKRGAAVYATK